MKDYKKKYLEYKLKYIQLKKSMEKTNQSGGVYKKSYIDRIYNYLQREQKRKNPRNNRDGPIYLTPEIESLYTLYNMLVSNHGTNEQIEKAQRDFLFASTRKMDEFGGFRFGKEYVDGLYDYLTRNNLLSDDITRLFQLYNTALESESPELEEIERRFIHLAMNIIMYEGSRYGTISGMALYSILKERNLASEGSLIFRLYQNYLRAMARGLRGLDELKYARHVFLENAIPALLYDLRGRPYIYENDTIDIIEETVRDAMIEAERRRGEPRPAQRQQYQTLAGDETMFKNPQLDAGRFDALNRAIRLRREGRI